MSKKYLLLAILISTSSFSQEYFEGILKFKIQIKDKTGQMSEDQAKQFIGTEQTYFLKGNQYKSIYNGLLEIVKVN